MNGLQGMTQDMNKDIVRRTAMTARTVLTVLILLLTGGNAVAQVTVNGSVYGGGDESAVINTTTPADASITVTLKGNTVVHGNVYGGGNRGVVSGSATVNIEQ